MLVDLTINETNVERMKEVCNRHNFSEVLCYHIYPVKD